MYNISPLEIVIMNPPFTTIYPNEKKFLKAGIEKKKQKASVEYMSSNSEKACT
jgi:hypothetical protein